MRRRRRGRGEECPFSLEFLAFRLFVCKVVKVGWRGTRGKRRESKRGTDQAPWTSLRSVLLLFWIAPQ